MASPAASAAPHGTSPPQCAQMPRSSGDQSEAARRRHTPGEPLMRTGRGGERRGVSRLGCGGGGGGPPRPRADRIMTARTQDLASCRGSGASRRQRRPSPGITQRPGCPCLYFLSSSIIFVQNATLRIGQSSRAGHCKVISWAYVQYSKPCISPLFHSVQFSSVY